METLPTVNPGTLGELNAMIKAFGISSVTCMFVYGQTMADQDPEPGRWRVVLDCAATGFGATIGDALKAALHEWIGKAVKP